MKRTRDKPCDEVVTSKNVAFLLSTHLFLPLFPKTFYDDFFRHPPHFFTHFLPPSINPPFFAFL